jgi:hypothetical protein
MASFARPDKTTANLLRIRQGGMRQLPFTSPRAAGRGRRVCAAGEGLTQNNPTRSS